MVSVFLSAALIYLASDQVGCVDHVVDPLTGVTTSMIQEECHARVYGAFKPASLVTNIATISGVLIAICLPVIGAILDALPQHRWTVGAATAVLLILTEGIQIGTTPTTWFGMAILEAISGLLFQVQLMASMSYLPDMAREVGQVHMNACTSCILQWILVCIQNRYEMICNFVS